MQTGGGALFFGGTLLIVFIVIVLVLSIFWVWMLIDCLMSNKPPIEKLIWFLVIFFLHILGALIYFFVGRSGRSAMV